MRVAGATLIPCRLCGEYPNIEGVMTRSIVYCECHTPVRIVGSSLRDAVDKWNSRQESYCHGCVSFCQGCNAYPKDVALCQEGRNREKVYREFFELFCFLDRKYGGIRLDASANGGSDLEYGVKFAIRSNSQGIAEEARKPIAVGNWRQLFASMRSRVEAFKAEDQRRAVRDELDRAERCGYDTETCLANAAECGGL